MLDGNSILNRAYYGIKLLTTKDGQYTNAIYGFLTTFRRLLDESSPDAVAVAFDLKAPTFRHKMYDGYKSNRKGMPEELASQMQPLKDIISALGYRIVTCEGYEADDILGTLARKCTEDGCECMIATGDRDSLQLVSPTVTVRIAATKFGRPEVTLYDEEKIKEVYGVTPGQLIDIKAIQGDTSDCIPGVPGIGEKGARDLVSRFGSLDDIYKDLDTIDIKPGIRKKLTEGRESAYLSLKLGTINTQAPIDTVLENYIPAEADRSAAAALLSGMEFSPAFMEKWGISAEDIVNARSEAQPQKVRSLTAVNEPKLMELYPSLSGKAVYLLAKTENGDITELVFSDGNTVWTADSMTPDFMEFTALLLADSGIKKHTYNVKPLYAAADRFGFECNSVVSDTMLAAYLLSSAQSRRLGVGYDKRHSCRRSGCREARAHARGRIDDNIVVVFPEPENKLTKHRRTDFVVGVKRSGKQIEPFEVFCGINSFLGGTISADGVGAVEKDLLLHVEHKVEPPHSAIAVDEQNLFVLFYKSSRKTDGNGGFTRSAFSRGHNNNVVHNTTSFTSYHNSRKRARFKWYFYSQNSFMISVRFDISVK